MAKSADAFRTISEVAEIVQVPAHVLRFWESKFTQVKPVKRAGGRRYYRPDDIRLLSGIRLLLHDEGMTIKGVQKILREQGVPHVAAMAPALPEIQSDMPEPGVQGAEVLSFERRSTADPHADPEPGPDEVDPAPDPAAALPPAEPRHPPPQAPDPTLTEPSVEATPKPLAPALPPLPDLPDDPPDTTPAAPGALSALARLRAPLRADLATRLSGLAAQLRSHGANGSAGLSPNDAAGH